MPLERSIGLILRTRPLTESSLIVHWLTADAGRLATVAKGARRASSPLRGKLDLFYLADLSFHRSRRGDLHQLREIALRETHPALRRDLGRLQQASYASLLLQQTTETDTPLPGCFDLMTRWLAHLCEQPAQPFWLLVFELKLLQELGLAPNVQSASINEGARALMRDTLAQSWDFLPRLRPVPDHIQELARFLHGFLIYHLERIPPGRRNALGDSFQPDSR